MPDYSTIKHPDYVALADTWAEQRLCYKGGKAFRDKYLKKFNTREDGTSFTNRSETTPITTFAKSCILEVKNAIFQRLDEVKRVGGSAVYQSAMARNVDRKNSSMKIFLHDYLDELLSMGTAAIWVDKPSMEGAKTKADTSGKSPYIYMYQVEDIRSWAYNDPNDPTRLTDVLLADHIYAPSEDNPFPASLVEIYRYAHVNDNGTVTLEFFDSENKPAEGHPTITLNIPEIPIVITSLGRSLMEDVTGHQIALLNMESGDVNYCIRANFPFYVEQYDVKAEGVQNRRNASPGDSGSAEDAVTNTHELRVGTNHGRRVPGTVAHMPSFIHPSPEPLKAAIEKEEQLKDEIRLLINLALSNMLKSAEAVKQDQSGLEAGLSSIALILEQAENRVGYYFALYEKSTPPQVSYPAQFNLQTNAERDAEIKLYDTIQSKLPTPTGRRAILKLITEKILTRRVDDAVLVTALQEIDTAKAVISDPEQVRSDVELGLVSEELASTLRGYPEGEVEIARKQHAERLARIAAAQTSAVDRATGETRAPADVAEKTISQQADTNPDGRGPAVRGNAQ